MSSATIAEIHDGIVSTIRDVEPTHPHFASIEWNEVHSLEDVPSADPRNFYVEIEIPEEFGEGFGLCAQHTAVCRVWTSYGSLKRRDASDMASADNHNLWLALNRAQLTGLPLVEKQGWEPEGPPGRLWGAHVFLLTVFLPLGT